MREAAKKLMLGVRRGIEPAKMRELISLYKVAMETDTARRVAAQTTLDAKIGWSVDPRIEGVLWLFGVLGEGEPAVTSSGLGPRGAYGVRNDIVPQRTGVVNGVVEGKGEDWIEVRENEKNSERYGLLEPANAPAAYSAAKEIVSAVKIGDRVQVGWIWNGRMSIVKLEILPATAYPTDTAPAPAPAPAPQNK